MDRSTWPLTGTPSVHKLQHYLPISQNDRRLNRPLETKFWQSKMVKTHTKYHKINAFIKKVQLKITVNSAILIQLFV